MTTIVGVDPSLTSLGLAAIREGSVVAVARVRSKGSTKDSLLQRYERQQGIIEQVRGFVAEWGPDLALIEGPSYGSKFGHPHDRSGLWWGIVSTLLVTAACPVVEVPPTVRMKYATGKGSADKDVVLAHTIKRYPMADITSNDVADAVILAAMGSRHCRVPAEESLPLTHLAAMDKIRW